MKWTYAYGYYLPEHEHAKRQFFEYLQGLYLLLYVAVKYMLFTINIILNNFSLLRIIFNHFSGEAESGLERLHQCAEKELQVYLDAEGPMTDFNDFRTKLAGLTR